VGGPASADGQICHLADQGSTKGGADRRVHGFFTPDGVEKIGDVRTSGDV